MRLVIIAAGRIRPSPERVLLEDYLERATRLGRSIGLGPAAETEIDNRGFDDAGEETAALLAAVPDGARRVILDERGRALTSPDFAAQLAAWRDEGARAAAFLIGGPDGFAEPARKGADLVLAFGPMVWPHRLVRVMLAEQLYRAVSILTGSPYHRD
ncbi:MAG: 23S rRNA (pseudouridine(1915)-N(3))-methyltransferase RlmH [Maricaulaceae bacterium]|nr:23S rRNA (pseudouridine(1915)-N(3))-methyltransferase RlmH [Maricaulaceae bacterium]